LEDHEHQTLIKHYRVHRAHNYLCDRFSWYHAWHHHPHHQKVHFGLAINALILAIVFCCLVGLQIRKYHALASAEDYTVTEKEQWEAGTNTDVDTESTNGDL